MKVDAVSKVQGKGRSKSVEDGGVKGKGGKSKTPLKGGRKPDVAFRICGKHG